MKTLLKILRIILKVLGLLINAHDNAQKNDTNNN